MSQAWFSLTVDLPQDALEQGEALLYEAGAEGLEVRDGVTPPLPGVRAPAPGEAILVASFSSRADAEEAGRVLGDALPGARCALEEVADKDWSVAWREQIRATVVGRLWIGPPWDVENAPPGLTRIVVEPKMAFGTGDHPTTQLCLEAVDAFLASHPGASVLDVGTGTGVLAIAAKKLGAARVLGIDNDATSVELAKECAEENGAGDVELTGLSLEKVTGRYALVLANILANTLIDLAPQLTARAAGRLVLSGVLVHQAADVKAAYVAAGMKAVGEKTLGEWIRLDFEPG